MRFYTQQHPHYCGIDLHARTMYLCILNQAGAIVLHRNMKSDPDSFLNAIAPFRENIVVAVECMILEYTCINLTADQRPREGYLLDFKAELTDNVLKTVTAFANTFGGLLFLGIADDKDGRPEKIAGIEYQGELKTRVAREEARKLRKRLIAPA